MTSHDDSTDQTSGYRPSGERPGRFDATTRRSVIKSIGAGAVAAGLGTGAVGTGSAVRIPTPSLHTEGRWIRDPTGNDVRLRGVAPAALDYIARSWFQYSWQEVLEWATDGSDRGWHPTVIRLPCTYSGINHHGGVETFVSEYLRPAVDLLATRDTYVMIDFHLIRPYTQQATEDYNADSGNDDDLDPIDDVVRDFWETVAPEFADDDHVLYEVFNEPTHPTTWSSYGQNVDTREESWQLWRETAQPWVDLLKAEAPDRPVVIGSPAWTSETQFAPQYPFEGEDLIYASHIYPDNGQPSEFDAEYGAPAEEVPCFLTEFGWEPTGGQVDQGTTSGWGEPVREWVEGYDNYSWTAWCFDDTWAPTFFESPADNPVPDHSSPWGLKDGEDESGWYVKQWLADTRDQGNPVSTIDDSQAPPAPANLTVDRVTEISATVSWDAVTDVGEAGLSSYDVFVDGQRQAQVLAGTTSATVEGLSADGSYEVAVRAVDAVGNASGRTTTTVETLAPAEGQSAYAENAIPGTVQAEDFDVGGNGISYFDTSPGNRGNSTYRDTDVDLGTGAPDSPNINYINEGEWWQYTADVAGTGTYVLFVNVATNASQGGSLRIEVDGEELATQNVWNTGGWSNYQEIRVGTVELSAGESLLRVTSTGGAYNLDYLRFEAQDVTTPDGTPTTEPRPTTEPTPVGTPGPVGPNTALPGDPDADGLYEDVNGNGRQDIADAVDLFQHRESVDPAFFDFNDSGEMEIGDAIEVFRENTG